MKHVLIFFSTAILDVMWAIYIKKVNQAKPLGASLVTVVIYMLGGWVIITYVRDGWYLASATAGAFVGTYGATKWVK